MVAPKRIIIVGDGTGGICTANKLSARIPPENAEIMIVGNSPKLSYRPAGLAISLGSRDYRKYSKDVRFLLNSKISYRRDTVEGVDARNKNILTKSGNRYDYDYLVIASGLRPSPEDIPGSDGEAKHFQDFNHAAELHTLLDGMTEGDLVIGSPDSVYSPTSSFEFAVLADEFLGRKGVRNKIDIKFFFPGEEILPIGSVSTRMMEVLDRKNISCTENFSPKRVSQRNGEIASEEGALLKYNLLVMPQPMKGQGFVCKSGLAEKNCLMPVQEATLQNEKFPEIFGVGDAVDFKTMYVPKTIGSTVMQSGVVAEELSRELGGKYTDREYRGEAPLHVYCGDKLAFSVNVKQGDANIGMDASLDYHFRQTGSDEYFSVLVRGMI